MASIHGKVGTYVKGCRCYDCRKVYRLYQQSKRGGWSTRGDMPEHERAYLETEPEYFHDRLRVRR